MEKESTKHRLYSMKIKLTKQRLHSLSLFVAYLQGKDFIQTYGGKSWEISNDEFGKKQLLELNQDLSNIQIKE